MDEGAKAHSHVVRAGTAGSVAKILSSSKHLARSHLLPHLLPQQLKGEPLAQQGPFPQCLF